MLLVNVADNDLMSSMIELDSSFLHTLYQTLTSIEVACLHIATKTKHLKSINKKGMSTL